MLFLLPFPFIGKLILLIHDIKAGKGGIEATERLVWYCFGVKNLRRQLSWSFYRQWNECERKGV